MRIDPSLTNGTTARTRSALPQRPRLPRAAACVAGAVMLWPAVGQASCGAWRMSGTDLGRIVAPATASTRLAAAAPSRPGQPRPVPRRGSSASLNGGSSADLYGGSSADKKGVADRIKKTPQQRAEERAIKQEDIKAAKKAKAEARAGQAYPIGD